MNLNAENGDSPLSSKLTDVDRLLLFEWHARHLESWMNECVPKCQTFNFPHGAAASDFHVNAMLLAIQRKFYEKGGEVSIGSVAGAMKALYTGDDPEYTKMLAGIQRGYREALRTPVASMEGDDIVTGEPLLYDALHGLLLHADPAKGERLRHRGKLTLQSAVVKQQGWRLVIGALRTLEKGREDGTLNLPEPYAPLW